MKYLLTILLGLTIIAGCTNKNENQPTHKATMVMKEVDYSGGGIPLKGYLAYYDSIPGEKKPGILVVPEWWGVTDFVRHKADSLARLGYIALVIDMYGNGKSVQEAKDAQKLSTDVMKNMDTAKVRFDAGMEFLKNQAQTDPSRIAAIGYCFGGGIALRMAINGEPLAGVVSFHGDLPTEQIKDSGGVKTKFLVCNGEADPLNPPKKVEAFRSAMDSARVDYTIINYPNAMHAFTNPAADSLGKKFNLPLAYNKEADKESWNAMEDFLGRIFMGSK